MIEEDMTLRLLRLIETWTEVRRWVVDHADLAGHEFQTRLRARIEQADLDINLDDINWDAIQQWGEHTHA